MVDSIRMRHERVTVWAKILKLAEERYVRIVFSGDTRQIQSVEAGDALLILEKDRIMDSN